MPHAQHAPQSCWKWTFLLHGLTRVDSEQRAAHYEVARVIRRIEQLAARRHSGTDTSVCNVHALAGCGMHGCANYQHDSENLLPPGWTRMEHRRHTRLLWPGCCAAPRGFPVIRHCEAIGGLGGAGISSSDGSQTLQEKPIHSYICTQEQFDRSGIRLYLQSIRPELTNGKTSRQSFRKVATTTSNRSGFEASNAILSGCPCHKGKAILKRPSCKTSQCQNG
jgi:hypothetical protein